MSYDLGSPTQQVQLVGWADDWKYQTEMPGSTADYSAADYDDSAWLEGPGGFGNWTEGAGSPAGTSLTPPSNTVLFGGTVPTTSGNIIWLRKTIGAISNKSLIIDIWHDDGYELWVNGVEVTLSDLGYFHAQGTVPPLLVNDSASNVIAIKVTDSVPSGSNTYVYASAKLSSATVVPLRPRVWPYQPDFSSSYEVKRSFLTDITTSRSNTERRRALRDVARIAINYRTVVSDDDLQAAKHFLRIWQNKPTALPDYSRWIATTGSSSGGAATLTIDSPPTWIAQGQFAILCGPDGDRELVRIAAVADPIITLDDSLSNAWPSGTIIRPAFLGLLNSRIQGNKLTRGTHAIGVQFAAYPGGEPPEDEGTASVTFNGYEVFTAEPDFSSQPSLDHIWPVEQVDYGIGRTAQFRPVDRQEQMVECEFTGLTPASALAIEQVFLRAKGRRGAFYRPSCEKDMTLAANTSGVAYFDAVGTDLYNDLAAASVGRAIEIVQTNGTRTRKLITGITSVGGNSRVAFSGALTLTVAGVARISWMPLVRFASDELATSWRGPAAGTIRTTFQTVKQ